MHDDYNCLLVTLLTESQLMLLRQGDRSETNNILQVACNATLVSCQPHDQRKAIGVLTCCAQVKLLLGGASKQEPAGDITAGELPRVGEGDPGAAVALGGPLTWSGKLAVG